MLPSKIVKWNHRDYIWMELSRPALCQINQTIKPLRVFVVDDVTVMLSFVIISYWIRVRICILLGCITQVGTLTIRCLHQCLWGKHSLQWRHNERDGVSNHRPHDYLLDCWFRRISKKISKLCITGLCAGNSPVTGEFPAQRASSAENFSISWCHHVRNMGKIDLYKSTTKHTKMKTVGT